MATSDDVDTNAAVRKFLDRSTVVSRTEEGSDQGEEITAILEAVAISFLLSPQSALTLILLAKNQLQQIVSKDIELIDYLNKAIEDVDNPDTPVSDLSDLTEASTALVEIDRLGSFKSGSKAFERYNTAVNRFLNQQLAKSLKRRRRGEFERSGSEARQDLSTGLSLFGSTHGVMAQSLSDLSESVDNFRSVDLTKLVSQKTVSKVRTSLQKVQRGFENTTISKTSAAIELLSGAASLQSISDERDIFDPTLETAVFPEGRNILISSEPTAATIVTLFNTYPISGLSSAVVSITVDEVGSNPFFGTFGYFVDRVFLLGQSTFLTNDIIILAPGPLKLYLHVEGISGFEFEFDLAPYGGSVSILTLQSDLNTLLNPTISVIINNTIDGRKAINFVGQAVNVSKIVILEIGPGTVDAFGIFTPADPSAFDLLGFLPNQTSQLGGFVIRDQLVRDFNEQIGTRLLAEAIDIPNVGPGVRVTSLSIGPDSSLHVGQATPASFGFDYDLHTAQPVALLLTESGQPVDPRSVGVFIGSRVFMADSLDARRSGAFTVTGIDNNRLLFDVELPRGKNKETKILAPAVALVQDLLRKITPFVDSFGDDTRDLQRVISPLLSRQPTLAQINDAKRVLSNLRARLTNQDTTGLLDILASVVVRDDQSDFAHTAKAILDALDERGLDRATDLLKSGKFSDFFALAAEDASKSSRFLKSVETVMTGSGFQTTTIESEMDDVRPSGTIPDKTLDDLEPSTEVR